MKYSEEIIPLTETDSKVIKEDGRTVLLVCSSFFALIIGMIVLIYKKEEIVSCLLFTGIPCLVVMLPVIFFTQYRIKKALKKGVKLRVSGTLLEKRAIDYGTRRARGIQYFFIFGENDIVIVDLNTYFKAEKGVDVVMEILVRDGFQGFIHVDLKADHIVSGRILNVSVTDRVIEGISEKYKAELEILWQAITKQQKKLIGRGLTDEISSQIGKLAPNKEEATRLIESYSKLFLENLIPSLVTLSSNYDEKKESVSVFIKYGLVDDTYPHHLKKKELN